MDGGHRVRCKKLFLVVSIAIDGGGLLHNGWNYFDLFSCCFIVVRSRREMCLRSSSAFILFSFILFSLSFYFNFYIEATNL